MKAKVLLAVQLRLLRVFGLPGTLDLVFETRGTNDKSVSDFGTLYATLSTAINAKGVMNITATVRTNNPKTLF